MKARYVIHNKAHTDLTETFRRDAMLSNAYLNENLYTQEYSSDEFDDVDDEYEGLTIVQIANDVELFEFCTGYDIL